MENPSQRSFFGVVKTIFQSKTANLLVLLLIVAAVPLTVFVAQQRQETRQRAQAKVEQQSNSEIAYSNSRNAKLYSSQTTTKEVLPAQTSQNVCACERRLWSWPPFSNFWTNKGGGCSSVGLVANSSCNPKQQAAVKISSQLPQPACECTYVMDKDVSHTRTLRWADMTNDGCKNVGISKGDACGEKFKNCVCDDDFTTENRDAFKICAQPERSSCGDPCKWKNEKDECIMRGSYGLRGECKSVQGGLQCAAKSSQPPPGSSSCQGKQIGTSCDNGELFGRCNNSGQCIIGSQCTPQTQFSDCPQTGDAYCTTGGTCDPKTLECSGKPPAGRGCEGTGEIPTKVCNDNGKCVDKPADGGRVPPPGRGGDSPKCDGSITYTCKSDGGEITANWNVSSKDGNTDSCNIYVHKEGGGDSVISNVCGDNKSGSVNNLNDGTYALYLSSGGNEGDSCYNERKDNSINVNCVFPEQPAPTAGNPNPDGVGAGQGITCGDNPSSLRPGELPPGGYKWKANCSKSCISRNDCPQNTFDVRNVNPADSNWCYGFGRTQADWKCMMLVKPDQCEQAGQPGCTGTCVAESLEPRFRVEGEMGGNWFPDPRVLGTPQVEAGTKVYLGVFKNHQQIHAGADATARITGPGIDRQINTYGPNSHGLGPEGEFFTPAQAGTYTLSVACGSASHNTSVTLTVVGTGSVCRTGNIKPRFQKNVSTEWTPALTNINLGESVRTAVFKGLGEEYAGAGTTAKIEKVVGANRTVVKPDVKTTEPETFTPTEEGDYELTANCGTGTEKATLKVNGIPDCNASKVDMTAKSVKNPSTTEIFVNEIIKFVVNGEQGQTLKRDVWTPSGVVDCAGAFFGSKLCKATGAGTVKWEHFWKNCAVGSETNCKPECSKPVNLTIKQIPNFEMEGNVSSESAGPSLRGMPGLTVKIRNDETDVTTTANTDANGNFVAPNILPRGDRYTIKIDGFDSGTYRIGNKEYFASSDYPVHTTLYESKTGAKKIQIKLKEKTADTQLPMGKITAGTCEAGIKGYACVRDATKILNIEIKDFGNTVVGRVQANLSGVDSECGNTHWFEFEPPLSLKDSAQHSISVRAINPDGSNGMELPGAAANLNSPLTFICFSPADLDQNGSLDTQDYAIIRDAYHFQIQTPFDTRSVSTFNMISATARNAAIQRYLNAEGKVDLRGIAEWMVDAYTYFK